LLNIILGGEKMSEYKTVKDITEQVKKKFPSGIEVVEAKIVLDPYDGYYLVIVYKIDDIQYELKQKIYANASETLLHMVSQIIDFYERTHNIQF